MTETTPVPDPVSDIGIVSAAVAVAAVPPRPPLLTGADLRFFATCYLAGLLFFLLMLS